MNISVLTSERSWFVPYAKQFIEILTGRGHFNSQLFHKHEDIGNAFEVVFIISYFRAIDIQFLNLHKHNLVVHESDLPKGKGWAPLFWQILENKNKIPIVLFEATENVDAGDIYIKDHIILEGSELNGEIRRLQAEKTIEICLRFLEEDFKLVKQSGAETFYNRRWPQYSQLDVNKSIVEQFNLLRIVNNQEFPAFFYHKDNKYVLQIYKV